MFSLEPYNFPQLRRETINDKRHYITPDGKAYPSVTTVLGDKKSPGLQAWIDRVGPEAALRKKTQGANRGTNIHAIYEDFVSNNFDVSKYDPITYSLWKSSERFLLSGLTRIHNLEFAVYSDRLRVAGTSDLLCEWYGVPSILDYKTAYRAKREDWIHEYFLQETIYAMCVFELIGLKVPQIVTFIVNETDPEPQVFVKRTEDYIASAIKEVRTYHARQESNDVPKTSSRKREDGAQAGAA